MNLRNIVNIDRIVRSQPIRTLRTILTIFQPVHLLSFSLLLACTPAHTENATKPVSAPTAARGKTIYKTQCIACHNTDPKKAGALGPEVFGSSLELLEIRLIKGEYPPGYKPKRTTHMMAPLPHLKNEIPSIHLYLNSNP